MRAPPLTELELELPAWGQHAATLLAYLPALLSPPQAPEYGGDPKWVSNDVVPVHDGRIYINLPASCTLMLVEQ